MMEPPPIQYAKTSDGVNIAYWTLGSGMPLVLTTPNGGVYSHLTLEWELPALREWYEQLTQAHTLVRYDPRNSGLSDRGVDDMTLDAFARDLEAVVDRLDLEQFDLIGFLVPGMAAVVYETSHPGRVRRLVLASTAATIGKFGGERNRAIESLLEQDYPLFLDNFARNVLGSSNPQVRDLARFFAQCVNQEDAIRIQHTRIRDIVDLLPGVTAQTLVIHYPGSRLDRLYLPGQARELASSIPNARLVAIPLEAPIWYADARVREVIGSFLSDGETSPAAAQGPALPQGTAVILFADIAHSTALTEQLGDAAFRERSRALDASLREAIGAADGRVIAGKVLGDGVMGVFPAASQAIECAIRCQGASRDAGLDLHLGLHAGDVIWEADNVYGGAVNAAARITDASEPGEILVSATVRDLARTSAGVAFEDRGEQTLKGIAERMRLYAVHARAE
jgi:class 3 adenylate cyclase